MALESYGGRIAAAAWSYGSLDGLVWSHAPLNLSPVRNFALAVAHRTGAANVAQQLREHLFHPTALLERLLRPELTLT